jgi:cytochrome c oxidase subunit 3
VKGVAVEHPGRREATAQVGMAIFLGAAAMLFAALFLAYAVMRAQAVAWPPPGQPALPRGPLGVNTLVLVGASVGLHLARRAARAGLSGPAVRRAAVALFLGALFLGAQVVIWRGLAARGSGPASGIYGSVFFAISGFHALHVAGGLIALGALVASARNAAAAFSRRLGLVTVYWDFVLAVWALFYVGACLR